MKRKLIAVFLIFSLILSVSAAGADDQGCWHLEWYPGGAMGIQVINITVDEEAEEPMSLWPVDTVTDVTLEWLDWINGVESTVLWQGDKLESNQVLNIRTYLSDTMPNLRVTCTDTEGQVERWYITDSGEDGSLILLPRDAIENIWQEVTSPDWSTMEVNAGTLIGVCYTDSGNELGNLYEIQLDWTEDGTPVLDVRVSETHDSPVTVSRYSVDPEIPAQIAQIVRESGMEAWTDRTDVMMVCDAPQPYLGLQILDGEGEREDCWINGYIMFTDEQAQAYHAAVRLLKKCCDEEHLLETYTIDRE